MSKKERIKDKIKLVTEFIDYLYSIFPKDLESYKTNITIKSACERHFEKIMEACTDIAFLIVRDKGLEMPEDEDSIFYVLAKKNFISSDLAEKLRSAKGMRNILAHQYGEIDDAKIFNSIEQELEKDINEFIEKIEKVF